MRLLKDGQKEFVDFALQYRIIWADAVKHIPLPDACAEVLYSSHMLEHLYREDARLFLQEAQRVLSSGGIIRIAVPDLARLANQYYTSRDADSFVEKTMMAHQMLRSILARLAYLITGPRGHLWMYDGPSLVRLLSITGFREARVMEPGTTLILNPDNLNLYERVDEAVYVEAYK
jgi:predicted SAM-dependent methyltransferase